MKIRRVIITILSLILGVTAPFAQVFVQLNHANFSTPSKGPFFETYLLFDGAGLTSKVEAGKLQNSVKVELMVMRDSNIVKAAKYNVQGPLYNRAESIPLFIDQQRYPIPPGEYALILKITDNYAITKKEITIKDSLHITYSKAPEFSSIELVESYTKAVSAGPLTKSGVDMVPFFGSRYGTAVKVLNFYTELYGISKLSSANPNIILKYYLLNNDNKLVQNFGGFKKSPVADVIPLLAKIDISNLGPGFYTLVVEAIDGENKLLAQKKLEFERDNALMEITTLTALSDKEEMAGYFGKITNADTLKLLLESLWPIADNFQKDQIINQSVKKDPELMKRYMIDFWQKRAADTIDPVKLWADYYREVQKAMANFKCGKQPGFYTDRGRVFLQYGAPSVRTIENTDENTYPYEIWLYYRTTDRVNGQFFSNRRFVFVNKALGDDCFKLIHSDMRGETNNPRWQFEVSRRNNNGLANPDNTSPNGTQFNRMNELYNSPR